MIQKTSFYLSKLLEKGFEYGTKKSAQMLGKNNKISCFSKIYDILELF